MDKNWYNIEDIEHLDSPALVIYIDRVRRNIATLVNMVDDVNQVRPHVKTHKSPDITRMLMEVGIKKFKCSTIAEAEMLGQCSAPDVLLAYQPQGPKTDRLLKLIKKYSKTRYSCLVDNMTSARDISSKAEAVGITIPVFIDLNVGMNRTGIVPGRPAIDLINNIEELEGIRVIGLHAYDGHIHSTNLKERKQLCDEGFQPVLEMNRLLQERGYALTIVAGGSPTFPIHIRRMNVECSPGTFIYWDKGYQDMLPEQEFVPAALVISRVISHPAENVFCMDLGHKSIAPENPLDRRVHFYDAPLLTFPGQSEEHLMVECPPGELLEMGQVLYGVPIHICPTVALYDHVRVIENGKVIDKWSVIARDRSITI